VYDIKKLQISMPKYTFEILSKGFMALEEMKRWTLVGGTALAIHFEHFHG